MKYKEYELISHFCIETQNEEQAKLIVEKLTYALIDIVESLNCYCGGGFQLKEAEEHERQS